MKRMVGLLAAVLAFNCPSISAQARDFTFAGWGGGYQEAQRKIYFTPFAEQQKIDFLEDTYLGGLAEIKSMVTTKQVKWDAVIVERSDLIVGCDEGLFERLDWSAIGGRESLIPSAAHDCGAGNVVISQGLAYDKDKISGEPASWADMWDLEKWPGKRGFRAGPKMNLEIALMADGVALEDLYKVLATKEGQDRAFRKLDQIKPQIQFWEAGAQPVEWLVAGNVTMSVAYNGRIANAVKEGKNLGFVWNESIYNIDSWAIPTGAPHKDLAVKFLKFANTAEPQAAFPSLIPYGPTNKEAVKLVDSTVIKMTPAGDNMKNALFLDDDFWADNAEQLNRRWNSWAAQ